MILYPFVEVDNIELENMATWSYKNVRKEWEIKKNINIKNIKFLS